MPEPSLRVITAGQLFLNALKARAASSAATTRGWSSVTPVLIALRPTGDGGTGGGGVGVTAAGGGGTVVSGGAMGFVAQAARRLRLAASAAPRRSLTLPRRFRSAASWGRVSSCRGGKSTG